MACGGWRSQCSRKPSRTFKARFPCIAAVLRRSWRGVRTSMGSGARWSDLTVTPVRGRLIEQISPPRRGRLGVFKFLTTPAVFRSLNGPARITDHADELASRLRRCVVLATLLLAVGADRNLPRAGRPRRYGRPPAPREGQPRTPGLQANCLANASELLSEITDYLRREC